MDRESYHFAKKEPPSFFPRGSFLALTLFVLPLKRQTTRTPGEGVGSRTVDGICRPKSLGSTKRCVPSGRLGILCRPSCQSAHTQTRTEHQIRTPAAITVPLSHPLPSLTGKDLAQKPSPGDVLRIVVTACGRSSVEPHWIVHVMSWRVEGCRGGRGVVCPLPLLTPAVSPAEGGREPRCFVLFVPSHDTSTMTSSQASRGTLCPPPIPCIPHPSR